MTQRERAPVRGRPLAPVALALVAAVIGACSHGTLHLVGRVTSSSSAASTVTATTSTTAGTHATAAAWDVIGRSVQGRPLRLRRLGTGPRKVLWIGGIHGNEPEGVVATNALPQAFEASGLTKAVTLLVLEDANPDGRAARTRTNAHGVDLNRNFPAPNFDAHNPEYGGSPLSQPESKALDDLIVAERPVLVIACHSWLGASFVNYDGPTQTLAQRFSRLSGMALRPSNALGEATPGSLGSWLSQNLGTAVLTLEWQRGSDPTRDWQQTNAAVLAALSG